jgi:inosine-uridine nucleoside N-ribohydrolase
MLSTHLFREDRMTRIHLDTDIGGDMDDLCALVMLLRWPGLDITGVTTVSDENGRRAGYVQYVLNLARRNDIPLAAGADVSDNHYRYKPAYPPDEENWPEPVPRRPGLVDDALSLLKRSIDEDAIVVGIGPFTNFALLEEKYPGILKRASLFLTGGCVHEIPAGYPQWTNEMDYNVQLDVRSARYALEHANPTLVPITVTCQTALRRTYLPRLSHSGPLGKLVVHQAEFCGRTEQNERRYGDACPALPRDIINFLHDPLTCAIALGWREGVQLETVALRLDTRDTLLFEIPDKSGIPTRLVTKIDGEAFSNYWCDMVCG